MTHYNKEREEHSRVNVGTIGHIDHGKTHLAKSIAGAYPQPSDWPDPERIENIFHNGGEALHYEQLENEENERVPEVLSKKHC